MLSFPRLRLSRQNALAGLDIGRHAIRLVELSRDSGGSLTLEAYGCAPLPDGVVDDDGIDDLEHVITAARRLLEKCGSRAGKTVIGIPSSAVATHVFRIARLPSGTEAQLETLAREHIAALLDYPAEDACIDFCRMSDAHAVTAHSDVLVAATHRDNVEDRVAIAESLHCNVVAADIDSYAAHAALVRSHGTDTATTALCQIDPHRMHLSLPVDGRVVQVHDDAGDAVTTDPMRVATAAARALQTWQAAHPGHRVQALVFSGTGATMHGLNEAFHRHTDITGSIADPFCGMSLGAAIDTARLARDAPACLVACGLALRHFN